MRRIVTPLVFVVMLDALVAAASHASRSWAAGVAAALSNSFTCLGFEGSWLVETGSLPALTMSLVEPVLRGARVRYQHS